MQHKSAVPSPQNGFHQNHANRLIASYRRLTGRDLVDPEPGPEERARMLWEAPFVVVSHGTESDPIFNYGNRAALDRFEMTWEEFTALPSRLSAEPVHRDERARLMRSVVEKGFIDDYGGVRISRTGRRFRIVGATVWNVIDEDGQLVGQAAMFATWENLF